MRSVLSIVCLLLATSSLAAEAESPHWNQFRGLNGAGVAAGFKSPLNIASQHAAWKTSLPPGKSSSVLWRDRIYVTGVESNRLVSVATNPPPAQNAGASEAFHANRSPCLWRATNNCLFPCRCRAIAETWNWTLSRSGLPCCISIVTATDVSDETKDFTLPFRPELPPGHPGFGLPLAQDPDRRKQQQNGLFDWRDMNKDGFWTKVISKHRS